MTQAKNSVAMEPMGFKKGLEKLLDEGISVKVVTTDRHPSIRKIMREDFPNIEHQFDPWHTGKGKSIVVSVSLETAPIPGCSENPYYREMENTETDCWGQNA